MEKFGLETLDMEEGELSLCLLPSASGAVDLARSSGGTGTVVKVTVLGCSEDVVMVRET